MPLHHAPGDQRAAAIDLATGQGALPAQDAVAQWHHACRMGCGGLHRQAGGTGPAATRASHPLPRRIRPECKPARAADALGARQAACGRCGASGRQRPRRAAQPRAEAPCDELGRVFSIDITTCAHCGGAVRIVASIEDPKAIRAILAHFEKHGALEQAHYRPAARAPPPAA